MSSLSSGSRSGVGLVGRACLRTMFVRTLSWSGVLVGATTLDRYGRRAPRLAPRSRLLPRGIVSSDGHHARRAPRVRGASRPSAGVVPGASTRPALRSHAQQARARLALWCRVRDGARAVHPSTCCWSEPPRATASGLVRASPHSRHDLDACRLVRRRPVRPHLECCDISAPPRSRTVRIVVRAAAAGRGASEPAERPTWPAVAAMYRAGGVGAVAALGTFHASTSPSCSSKSKSASSPSGCSAASCIMVRKSAASGEVVNPGL